MSVEQPPEQTVYARWLDAGTRVGSAILLACFVVYLSGWVAPQVPLEQLPQVWNLPVRDYLAATGQTAGWSWLARLGHSDVVNLLGIGALAGCSVLCLLVLARLFLRRGDRAYAAICMAEIAVLVVAASGIFGGGH